MQKHVNLVDLVKSFPTNIYLQNLASIQKRTRPVKFAHLAEKSGKGSISNLSTKIPSMSHEKKHLDWDSTAIRKAPAVGGLLYEQAKFGAQPHTKPTQKTLKAMPQSVLFADPEPGKCPDGKVMQGPLALWERNDPKSRLAVLNCLLLEFANFQ